jgi:hypothetical protein
MFKHVINSITNVTYLNIKIKKLYLYLLTKRHKVTIIITGNQIDYRLTRKILIRHILEAKI